MRPEHGVLLALLVGGAVGGCGSDTVRPDERPTDLVVSSGADQVGLEGVPLADSIVVVVMGRDGPLSGVDVDWSVLGGGEVWPGSGRTDAEGRAMALFAPGAGPDSIRARAGDYAAMVRAVGRSAVAGDRHLGRRGYVEYRAGALPIVISAPHGGTLEPSEIPDRTSGVTVQDRNTDVLATALADALEVRFGQRPHVIVSHLHRSKLDPNREIVEAAQGHPLAEQTWEEFHSLVEHARRRVSEEHEEGFYLDLHGHGHPIQRLELGYLLGAQDLARSDAELDQGSWAARSSIRALVERSGAPFSTVLRGPNALGSLLEATGYAATPSDAQPDPGDNPFFSGGYNTARHGSRDGGSISGVQVEAQFTGVRDTPVSRAAFAAALAGALEIYLGVWYP